MKKRLLITSIVMMLVVAVALSTATYAWFTSNASVTASQISLKAEVNGASSLGIGWLGDDAGTTITSDVKGILIPMAPDALTKASTTSDVLFRSATIKEEGSIEKFNNDKAESYVAVSSSNITVGSTDVSSYFLKEGGAYVPATGLAVEGKTYYSKNFAPVFFNNNAGVQAFYVKNLSHNNNIGTITVSAEFTEANAYVLTSDARFLSGTTYYTNAGTEQAPNFQPAEVTVGSEVTLNTYYEKVTANDLIRVAIFTKAASEGTSTASSYTLLGVLGAAETTYTQVTKNTDSTNDVAYDRNTTYYTKNNDEYTQIAISAYDDSVTYYTAANTAAFGSSTLFDLNDNVKDLSHYREVKTSLTLTNSLAHDYQIDIIAVIWLDGTLLTDTRAGEFGQVSLKFQA